MNADAQNTAGGQLRPKPALFRKKLYVRQITKFWHSTRMYPAISSFHLNQESKWVPQAEYAVPSGTNLGRLIERLMNKTQRFTLAATSLAFS